jgi:hypothetical protein
VWYDGALAVRARMHYVERSSLSFGDPILGEDFTLARYTYGDRDGEGNLVWHNPERYEPHWDRIRIVTVDLNPDGEAFYRNYYIHKDRPLDPPLPPNQQGPYHYDIRTLVANAMNDYGIDYGGGGVDLPDDDEPPPPPPQYVDYADDDDDELPPPRRRVVKKRSLVTRIFRRLFGLRG